MIEAYAFLAAFTMQILVVSVLHPAWFTKYARAKGEAQLPGWDRKSRERFLSLYRVVNIGIAVLGLVLLGWLFNHMRSPDWDVGPVTHLLARYVVVQILPFVLVSLMGAWVKRKALTRSPPEVKLCTVTLVYALNAFLAYWLLYRRKRWPLETSAYRMHAVGLQVKIAFYTSIAVIVFLSLNVTLQLLDMQRWVPFAMSVYFVLIMLFTSMMLFALRQQAEADRRGPSPAS